MIAGPDMAERKAATMSLSGNSYAKVAERLKLFRTDWPNSKTETDHTYNEDGSVEFKAWVWKDKNTLFDLIKGGVTDKETLRATADADGDAKGEVGVKAKDFEKLQTIATGRALANLGYLASGEIASFEEMDEFNRYKEEQQAEAIKDAIQSFDNAKTLDELRDAFIASKLMNVPEVVAAKDRRKAELSAPEAPNADADS